MPELKAKILWAWWNNKHWAHEEKDLIIIMREMHDKDIEYLSKLLAEMQLPQ